VDDVPVLFEYFAKQHIVDGKKPIRLHPTSMQLFLDYSWPGNVRELANLVDRYSSLYPGQEVDLRNVIPSMVPPGIRALASWPQANAEQRPAPKAVTDYVSSSEPLGAELFAAVSGASEAESLDRINDAQLNYEVEQTILLAQGGGAFPEEGLQLKQHLLDIECNLIRHALSNAGGNVSKTARMLNLQRTTLIEKINKHGLADSA